MNIEITSDDVAERWEFSMDANRVRAYIKKVGFRRWEYRRVVSGSPARIVDDLIDGVQAMTKGLELFVYEETGRHLR